MKHLKFGLFLAIFALVLVGCEKEEPIVNNYSKNNNISYVKQSHVHIVNRVGFDVYLFLDGTIVGDCPKYQETTVTIEEQYVDNPLLVEAVFFNSNNQYEYRLEWNPYTFKNGKSYKMMLVNNAKDCWLQPY